MKRSYSNRNENEPTDTNKRAKIMEYSMNSIPQDVWPLIASFTDDKTKRQMRLANTTWFNIIRYNKFRIYYARSENIQAISERLSRYSWPIELHFVKPKFNDVQDLIDNLPIMMNLIKISSEYGSMDFSNVTTDSWLKLSTLTNIQSWKLGERYVPIDLWKKFVNLTEWTDSSKTKAIASILKQLTNLDSLNFDSQTSYPLVLNPSLGYNIDKITKLVMPHATQQDKVAWSHLTNLKELIYAEYENSEKDSTVELSYLTALENLNFCTFGAVPSLAKNTNLTQLEVYYRTLGTLFDDISHLKNIRILSAYDTSGNHSEERISYEFLADLVQLEKLILQTHVHETIFPHLPNSLKSLSLDTRLDVAQLTHLTNLQEMRSKAINYPYLTALSNLTYIKFCHDGFEPHLTVLGKLTQLVDLFVSSDFEQSEQETNIPDLIGLINLKKLCWDSFEWYPSVVFDQLVHLTNLEELSMEAGLTSDVNIGDCNFLSGLINLTNLRLNLKVGDQDSIWQNIEKLTKLQFVELEHIDNDDRLISFTKMNNLTNLGIASTPKKFSGRHLTALTNLQCLRYHKKSPLVYKEEDLMQRLPNLWLCDKFVAQD